MLTKKRRKRVTDIPPYIVPLSTQAQEIVRFMLGQFSQHSDTCSRAPSALLTG